MMETLLSHRGSHTSGAPASLPASLFEASKDAHVVDAQGRSEHAETAGIGAPNMGKRFEEMVRSAGIPAGILSHRGSHASGAPASLPARRHNNLSDRADDHKWREHRNGLWRSEMEMPEKYSRGYLPHIDREGHPQAITYRLDDAISLDTLKSVRKESGDARDMVRRLQHHLDRGMGACWLRHPEAANIVVEAMRFYDGERYNLVDWVVMPNHVHVLIEHIQEDLGAILHSWRSYTAMRINNLVERSGRLWQRGYWDRYIRDREHYMKARCYIYLNPVEAELVDDPFEWEYTSLHEQPTPEETMKTWLRRWSEHG